MRSAFPLATLAVTVTVLLTGCVPQDPEVVPPPEPTTEAVFASDEKALAAATDAYEAYLAMSDLIAQEGGKDPERIDDVAVREARADALAGYEVFRDSEYRSIGESTLGRITLQRFSESAAERTDVAAIYACLDLTGVDVVNSVGESVVEASRPDVQPFEISFDLLEDAPQKLVVSSRQPWSGENFCAS